MVSGNADLLSLCFADAGTGRRRRAGSCRAKHDGVLRGQLVCMFENTQGSLNQVMQALAKSRTNSERRAIFLAAAFILRAGRRNQPFVRDGFFMVAGVFFLTPRRWSVRKPAGNRCGMIS